VVIEGAQVTLTESGGLDAAVFWGIGVRSCVKRNAPRQFGDGGVCFLLGPACHVDCAMLRVEDVGEALTAACVATCHDEAGSMYWLAYLSRMFVVWGVEGCSMTDLLDIADLDAAVTLYCLHVSQLLGLNLHSPTLVR
jgi:hypothetical protein